MEPEVSKLLVSEHPTRGTHVANRAFADHLGRSHYRRDRPAPRRVPGRRHDKHWAGWLAGDLRGVRDGQTESALAFWALPGSFAVPLILFGLVAIRLGRQGQILPAYVGWVLGAWVVLGAVILEPSGFPLGLIPTALFVAANAAGTRAEPAVAPVTPTPTP